MTAAILDRPDLRDRTNVFLDRQDAGAALANLLLDLRGSTALVLAIPAGGVPVGLEIARRLFLDFDLAVVSKLTPPGETELGIGAVAWEGTVLLNSPLIRRLGLADDVVRRVLDSTWEKVERRMELLRESRPLPSLTDRPVVIVDDGLASGFTMRVAVEAVRKAKPASIIVAVPTGHRESLDALRPFVDSIRCPNIRQGLPFAVADAYVNWSDVPEAEAAEMVRLWRSP